ncbi:MAG: hypothetical protein AAF526_05625 [Pseudomonadota bacterium]
MSIQNGASVFATVPPLHLSTIGVMFVAGAVATTVFDSRGQVISPGIGWANLSPHGLARSPTATRTPA